MCVRGGQEEEYMDEIITLSEWSNKNRPLLNTSTTKEMIFDFQKSKLVSIKIRGKDNEVVLAYKYHGVHLDSKLHWSLNMESWLLFLGRLRPFDACSDAPYFTSRWWPVCFML